MIDQPPIRELGQGGMGVVHLHTATVDKRRQYVAVKSVKAGASQEERQLFLHEAWVAYRLEHPNIVRTLAVLSDPPRIVMNYIDGVTFRTLLPAYGAPHDPPRRWPLIQGILDLLNALDFIHRTPGDDGAALVHRDVKPQNMMVTRDGVLVLLDFGIVAQGAVDSIPILKGTIPYMSPEQVLRQGRLSPASDLFSACIVLEEVRTGRAFWNAQDAMQHLLDETAELLPPAVVEEEGAEGHLARIIWQGLHRHPAERYQSAMELRNKLVDWLDEWGAPSEVDRRAALGRLVPASLDPLPTVPPVSDSLAATETLAPPNTVVQTFQLMHVAADDVKALSLLFEPFELLDLDYLESTTTGRHAVLYVPFDRMRRANKRIVKVLGMLGNASVTGAQSVCLLFEEWARLDIQHPLEDVIARAAASMFRNLATRDAQVDLAQLPKLQVLSEPQPLYEATCRAWDQVIQLGLFSAPLLSWWTPHINNLLSLDRHPLQVAVSGHALARWRQYDAASPRSSLGLAARGWAQQELFDRERGLRVTHQEMVGGRRIDVLTRPPAASVQLELWKAGASRPFFGPESVELDHGAGQHRAKLPPGSFVAHVRAQWWNDAVRSQQIEFQRTRQVDVPAAGRTAQRYWLGWSLLAVALGIAVVSLVALYL